MASIGSSLGDSMAFFSRRLAGSFAYGPHSRLSLLAALATELAAPSSTPTQTRALHILAPLQHLVLRPSPGHHATSVSVEPFAASALALVRPASLEHLLLGVLRSAPGHNVTSISVEPFAASALAHGNVTLVSIGAAVGVGLTAGLLLCKSTSPGQTQNGDLDDTSQLPEDQGDPLKTILRLIRKMCSGMSRLQAVLIKRPAWYVLQLEKWLGQEAAGHLMMAARCVRDWWSEFYMIILTGCACFALKINLFEGFRILNIIIQEKRQYVQNKLAAYARAAKDTPYELQEADHAVAFSFFDLNSQEHYQVVLLMRGNDQAILRDLVDEYSKNQPTLPVIQNPAMRKLVKLSGDAAIRKILQEFSKQRPVLSLGQLTGPSLFLRSLEDPSVRHLLVEFSKDLPVVKHYQDRNATRAKPARRGRSALPYHLKPTPAQPMKQKKPRPGETGYEKPKSPPPVRPGYHNRCKAYLQMLEEQKLETPPLLTAEDQNQASSSSLTVEEQKPPSSPPPAKPEASSPPADQ